VTPWSAILLAAGRSTRMGRDKALLEIDGAPQWQRQQAVLAATGADELFLSARPEQAWARDARGFEAVVHDAMPDCGPIIGLTAGLERMTRSHLAVLAIDLPTMTPAWFGLLRERCEPGLGAVGVRGDFFEPLAAVYPRELKWLAWETVARGEYSLQKLLRAAVDASLMRPVEIGEAQEGWFRNWNEREG
jgi:molybdopterin-guanine dinucleotide biosynthesis protein A